MPQHDHLTDKPLREMPAPKPADFSSRKTAFDSWWRTQSATMALLRHAYQKIEEAERRLEAQEHRIQQLEELAETDPLTGLMNRRGFEKFVELEMSRIRRLHSPGALLVLVDLDRFKQINDINGHQAGDECLKLVADHLLKSIRFADGAARFGGDEFAILLTQTAPEKAMARAQKIRQVLNDMRLNWQGEKLHFGASIGIAPATPESDFPALYKQADTGLYADKQDRRQRGLR